MPYNLYAWYFNKGYDLVDVKQQLEEIKEIAEKLNAYDIDRYMIVEKSNKKGDCVVELETLERPKVLSKKN